MVGYTIRNLDSIDSSKKCSHCWLLLRDPVQLIECAHHICQSCAILQLGDPVICPKCKQTTPRNKLKLDRGWKNDMQNLSVNCSFCDWNGLLKSFQSHLDEAHPNPICEYCNEKYLTIIDLNEHIFYNCPQALLDCPLKILGCGEKIRRIDLLNHYLTEQHQLSIINFVVQRRLILSGSRSTYLETNNSNKITEFNENTDILFAAVQTLKDEQERIRNESIQIEHGLQITKKGILEFKKSVEEQVIFVDKMTADHIAAQKDLKSMEEHLNNMILSSNDGMFIWKINGIQQKTEAARSNIQPSIYSPPFYSSPTGYKMCLRLYLDGDGSARQTHMSLFFVLMRGEYDAILHFPFCFNIILCLLDQSDKHEHIFDILEPNVLSNSFKRPQTDMNIASGLPKFVHLSILQKENNSYIRDDTMFIKAMINFTNVPKEIIPNILNIQSDLTN